jgi:glycerate 2-kinase
MKKILLAPNSFKECSSSVDVSNILNRMLAKYNKLIIKELPISDGGDGFLDVCIKRLNLDILTFETRRPYGSDLFASRVGYSAGQEQLYIESAEVIGLKNIPIDMRHPLELNSKGLGDLFKLIIESGLNVDKIELGVGGTGTSDLGLGFCSAFGLKLYDILGKEVNIIPRNYLTVSNLEWKKAKLPFKIEVIADVDNPLLGENGAARTFAGQKGASKNEIDSLELGFEKLINLFYNKGLIGLSDKLSGAGGGLAGGLQIFFNAQITESRKFIADMLVPEINRYTTDYVITGEGAFDKQSLMDKGAKVVIDACEEYNIPVFLVCGKIDKNSLSSFGKRVIPIELQSFFKSRDESIKNFEKGLEIAAEKIINYIFST